MKARDGEPVKLFASIISADEALMESAAAKLSERFGSMDFSTAVLSFANTDYYKDEMGEGLKRRMVSFAGLADPTLLPDIKRFSNAVEDEFLSGGKRRVNIDPGYVTLERVVLASCKNFPHRIYLGRGVYGEVTLTYRGKAYRTLEWTYPDYATGPVMDFLVEARRRYAEKIGRGVRGKKCAKA